MLRPSGMRRRFGSAAMTFLVAAGLVLSPAVSTADSRDPDAARIAAAKRSLEWNWTPPGRAERYGHAETLIHAPISSVRTRVLDYAHYKDILPSRFKMS